ncbi:glycosyltransferase [Haliangium ochraceum]|uniref:Glycosyltransferase, MGT family n=1 Tax=Haliangium ochraceum (strain DSM 14365 / JCM 11303 / SMP-2) TaxID=502025 RepID=D0LGD8_HALO1|nr:nucleotide disphospho-sugar-binding domain-containing protein [Haliangium ochraceum]ACY18163.1 glycosyltransferase, MGT family [Haliangium ochraceum DSM 14365]
MTRILIVTLPERGHYHPLLGPAEELSRRGAEVVFACSHDIGDDLADVGVERFVAPPGAAPLSDELRGAELARLLADPEALRGWIRDMLAIGPARHVEPMRAIVRELRPDVVAIDAMAYEGAIAAELEGVPWVGWATSLNPAIPAWLDSELIRTLRALDPVRHALFAEFGLRARFRVSDVLSPRGTAVFATDALIAPTRAGEPVDDDVHLVGPSLGGRRSHASPDLGFADGRPLIYASFGSQAWHQPQRFERLFEAARTLDAALLVAAGDLAAEYAAQNLPAHVRCVPFAPQLEVLAHARALVTHGGANSVMEALAAGVPLLVAPLCNDQPHNRLFVERAGAGLGIDLDTCAQDALLSALRALLADGRERTAAQRIAASYAASDGARGAAELALRCCP